MWVSYDEPPNRGKKLTIYSMKQPLFENLSSCDFILFLKAGSFSLLCCCEIMKKNESGSKNAICVVVLFHCVLYIQ